MLLENARAASIPLPFQAFRLPDFRNQGVWLRVLLAANALLAAVAFIANRHPETLLRELTELAARVEPALFLALLALHALAPFLQRLHGMRAFATVVAIATACFAAIDALWGQAFDSPPGWHLPLAGALGAALLLHWLDLGARALSPALAEARLTALTARIRPHFLFNSLNAVLGVMRDDPRRAEAALEELAELFRALMRENRTLVPLSDEIALARKYLDIEHLRIGERLRVEWEVAAFPPEMHVPPLLLQPLLENAIYHGIEPATDPGTIHVRIAPVREGVRIEIDNPWHGGQARPPGNRMALANLRERLLLFYDLEAGLDTRTGDGRFRVTIQLPARQHG